MEDHLYDPSSSSSRLEVFQSNGLDLICVVQWRSMRQAMLNKLGREKEAGANIKIPLYQGLTIKKIYRDGGIGKGSLADGEREAGAWGPLSTWRTSKKGVFLKNPTPSVGRQILKRLSKFHFKPHFYNTSHWHPISHYPIRYKHASGGPGSMIRGFRTK